MERHNQMVYEDFSEDYGPHGILSEHFSGAERTRRLIMEGFAQSTRAGFPGKLLLRWKGKHYTFTGYNEYYKTAGKHNADEQTKMTTLIHNEDVDIAVRALELQIFDCFGCSHRWYETFPNTHIATKQ